MGQSPDLRPLSQSAALVSIMIYLTDYARKLRDPQWKALRQRLFSERDYTCQDCGRVFGVRKLQLHHKYYESKREPWNYPDDCFKVLCAECHQLTTEALISMNYALGAFTGDQLVDISGALINAICDSGDARIVANWLNLCLSDLNRVEISLKEGLNP